MKTRVTVLAACVLAIACCAMVVSSRYARRSKVVVYDREWSRTAGVANLICAPTVRDACREEALSDEVSFSKTLLSAFETAPTCKDIEFVVDTGAVISSQDADAHLLSLRKAPHWRLRVDFHPRLMAQPFSLDLVGGGLKDYSRIGGESSATDMASFACKMSKSNGVVDYW